jgi:hypothetical protein
MDLIFYLAGKGRSVSRIVRVLEHGVHFFRGISRFNISWRLAMSQAV